MSPTMCPPVLSMDAFTDAARLAHLGHTDGGYALAYGSHAQGVAGATSDLDLLFVGVAPVGADRARLALDGLVTAVRALHHRHGLELDEEVDYEVKLHATAADVERAVALDGFVVDQAGRVVVSPVEVTDAFLNSPQFRLRLILNALTTEHVFLGGDHRAYREHVAAAERSVVLLALDLLGTPRIRVEQLVRVLLGDGLGHTGRDYLGYHRVPHLLGVTHRGLAALAVDGVVHLIDGEHLEHAGARRRPGRPRGAAGATGR